MVLLHRLPGSDEDCQLLLCNCGAAVYDHSCNYFEIFLGADEDYQLLPGGLV